MSSFIGHALTGAGIYLASNKRAVPTTRRTLLWTVWLIVVALAPDLDYVIPQLNRAAHQGLRISHSITFALLLPVITIVLLSVAKVPKSSWAGWRTQLLMAGLSHLILDLLVGVTALPIFWPLTTWTLKLPFGILPSAPGYALTNYYMYRNALIELGIFVPLWLGIYYFQQATDQRRKATSYWLWLIALCFMGWGYTLAR